MLDRWTQTLTLLMMPAQTHVLLRQGWLLPRTELLGTVLYGQCGTGELPLAALEQAFENSPLGKGLRGLRTRILLHEDFMRLWTVQGPINTVRLLDAEAACAMRFQSIYEEPLAGWHWVADVRPSQRFVAAALRLDALLALQAFARAQGLHLCSISPWNMAVWNHVRAQLAPDAWLAWLDGEALRVCATEGDTLAAVQTVWLDAQATGSPYSGPSLDSPQGPGPQLEALALRLGLAAPAQLLMPGHVPAPWLESRTQGCRVQKSAGRVDLLDALGVSLQAGTGQVVEVLS